jgi:hypothetical protein
VIDQSRSTTSTSTSTSASATSLSSGFPATCPTDDQKNITDTNGISYQLRCSSDISSINGGPESGFGASNNFNDCILQCDTYIFPGNNIACSGFAYVGGVNGVGAGTCYLKGGAPYNVVAASNTVVAAVRLAATSSASGSTVQATTTTTSTTQTTTTSTTQTSTTSTTRTTTTSTTQTTTTSTTQMTTTSTTLTTTTTTSSSASYTPSQAVWPCPDYDGEYRAWPDNQNRGYTFACSAVVYPSTSFTQQPAPNNWNDCITQCNNLASMSCTGFWYTGGVNGQGPGTCYFINFNNGGFLVANNTNVAGRLGTYFDTYRATTTITSTTATTTTTSATSTTTSTTTTSSASSVQTLTYTTVSYATVTTTSSYPVTTTAVSTQVRTVTTSYPVTTTQVTTAPGKFGTLRWPESKVL